METNQNQKENKPMNFDKQQAAQGSDVRANQTPQRDSKGKMGQEKNAGRESIEDSDLESESDLDVDAVSSEDEETTLEDSEIQEGDQRRKTA